MFDIHVILDTNVNGSRLGNSKMPSVGINLKIRWRIAINDKVVKIDIDDNDNVETVWPASVNSMSPPF